MKKIIIIIASLFLLVAGAVAGGLLPSSDSTIRIPSENRETLIDSHPNITVINPSISGMKCAVETCKFSVYQEYLINERDVSIDRRYCTREEDSECVDWTDYTSRELTTNRDEWIKNRLIGYAEVIEERKTRIYTPTVGGGTVDVQPTLTP